MNFLKPVLLLVIGIILGLSIGVYRISGVESNPVFFKNGSWQGCKNLPLGKNDLLTAQVTIFALFALPSEEAIYLFAARDEKQERLHGDNDYTITGNIHDIHARYWSITAYGRDLYLIPNEAERYSFNYTNLLTDSAGNYTIVVSHDSVGAKNLLPLHGQQGYNWLPSPDKAKFNLILRVYKGDKEYIEELEKSKLPEIKRI